MSTEEAYHEALRRIDEAAHSKADRLILADLDDLEKLPPEIGSLTELRTLDLDSTKISNLVPLQRLTNLSQLFLSGTQITDLTPLQGLAGLQMLHLSNTQVTDVHPLNALTELQALFLNGTSIIDIGPLQNLVALQILFLSGTQITDFAALQNLTDLQKLYLGNTQITDLAPLEGLSKLKMLYLVGADVADLSSIPSLTTLEKLYLNRTAVTDLRPVLSVPSLLEATKGGTEDTGVNFWNTPAANADPILAEIAEIEDDRERTEKLFAHLRTLPPWPEPLTSAVQSTHEDGSAVPPTRPGNKPAPVMVRPTETGDIVSAPAEPNLEDAAHKRAEDAWHALRHYLNDLASLRTKIDNAMPALGRAFQSFERALGDDFANLNEIDLGMQADRIRLLAQDADTYLMDQDPAELAAFVAQLALYMQRFNAWGQYQEDVEDPTDAHITDDRDTFQNLTTEITSTEQIAGDVNAALKDVTDAGTAEDATSLQKRGALDSHANVLDAISERGIAEKSQMGEKMDALMVEAQKEAGQNFRSKVIESPYVSGPVWAICFLFNNRAVLEKIAARYPSRFKFLTDVLRFLFP